MTKTEEPLSWIVYFQDLLKELRCADHPEHRVQAVELLLEQDETRERNTSLVNAAINDPDPAIKEQILRILFNHFGKKIYEMLDEEKTEGVSVENPWLIPCSDPRNRSENVKLVDLNFINKLDYRSILKEIRCEDSADHRIAAAQELINRFDQSQRIAQLVNMVLYDPEISVRKQVKELLLGLYGNELESIIKVEGSDGVPIETPWMLPCILSGNQNNMSVGKNKDLGAEVSQLPNDLSELYDALRNPSDVKIRLYAAKELAKNHTEENQKMLAKAVLFDPDENVQQQAYQSLYEAAGDDKTEMLLDEIANQTADDEEWLLLPEYENEDNQFLKPEEESSLFGLNQADQIRGMVNLFTGEQDPQKRIAILQALARSKDVTTNEAIARVGLFDENVRVREFAKMELEKRLGNHLDEFLNHIYDTSSSFYPDPEEDEIEEADQVATNQVTSDVSVDRFSDQLRSQPPVIEEGSNLKPLVFISAIVILGMTLFLILR